MMTWLKLIICYKKQLIDKFTTFTTIYGYNEQIMMIPSMFVITEFGGFDLLFCVTVAFWT